MSKSTVSSHGARFIDFDTASDGPRVVFLCRDPGSWNAILPVLDRVVSDRLFHPYALVAGWTQERLEREPKLVELQFPGAFDRENFGSWTPAAFVTGGGVTDHHLEVAARELFPQVPMLCIEDNYGQYGKLFRELARRELALPETVCCIDEESRRDLVEAYAAYAGRRASVTGQPAFDRILPVGGADRRAELRRAIGVEASASLVTFVGTVNVLPLVQALAGALAVRECRGPVYAFRQHPRDATWPGLYLEAFDRHGLTVAETDGATTDDVATASDLVVSTWSTELIHATHRAIPAIYAVDRRYVEPDQGARFPLPPVRLGAALHADTVEDAAHLVQMLVDAERAVPDLADLIRRNQMRHYARGRRDATGAVIQEIRRLFAR